MTRILIIYTGGTVGMMQDTASKSLRPIGFDEIASNFPELSRLDYQWDVHTFSPPLDSSDMNLEVWATIAGIIQERYDDYSGFVVLHGSDTMAFTASALSFMLENLDKPVVLTGSQLPIGAVRTDARENIISAMEIAADRTGDKATVPEVCIYFDYQLFRGNRAKKYNAEKFEAFYSMNYPALAEAGVSIKFRRHLILPPPEKPLRVHKALKPDVAVLKIFPGITPRAVEAVLNTPGIRGVLMETYGSGNTFTSPWFLQALSDAVNRGILILNITQCDGGAVELGRYQTSKHLLETGVVSGSDMTFEAAITKMMYLFSFDLSHDELKKLLETPLRGELTPPRTEA